MFRSAVSVSVVLVFGAVANAEKYVVDLECVVFDRGLTDAEKREIRESHGATFSKERLRLLRRNAHQRFVFTGTSVVAPRETASLRMETDTVLTEAHICLIEAGKQSCKLDIQWGFAMKLGDRRSLASAHTAEHSISIGEESSLSGTSTEGACQEFILRLRRATDKDLGPKKLPNNFEDQLRNKL